MLLGSRENRQFVRKFEKFLSESFFKNQEITLIPDYEKDILKINIEHQIDREIHNVGDGIQAIIINTFEAFKCKDEALMLFIEEPEITMHPSIQRILIETLINKFKNLQIFITTHSNHFLDLTYDYPDDVAIFSFEEEEKEKFIIKNVTNNAKILDLLGIRNSSVFLSNCIVWTEGVTDRMLLRKLLELEKILYKEDYHYAFAEYGGSNLENFNFAPNDNSNSVNVESITKNNYLIIDNDDIKTITNPKYIRRKNLKSILGEDMVFDQHIEIENLIPYKVWEKVIEQLLKNKSEKRIKLKDKKVEFEKKFNDSLNKIKIGILLKKYLIEPKVAGEASNYFKNNNIQCLGEDKKTIMTLVIKVIDDLSLSLDNFPQQAKDLIVSILAFVKNNN